MENKIIAKEEYSFRIALTTIADVNEFCNIMSGLESFVVSAEVRSGTYIVDAKSLLGMFSLDLSKPVEVWFTAENKNGYRDMNGYFADKVGKWIVGD